MNHTRLFALFLLASMGGLSLLPLSARNQQIAASKEERIIALPELTRPRGLIAENGRVFIADSREVLVYDLDSGRFLMRIGKLGQGPGEFPSGPTRPSLSKDRLYVQGDRRLECFALSGKYIDSIHEPDSSGYFPYLPVGRHFVAFPLFWHGDGSLIPTGCIYDMRLRRLLKGFAELPAMPPVPPPPGVAEPAGTRDRLLVRDYGDFVVGGERIYVADSRRGFSISVFDENGRFLREISHPYDKIRVPKKLVQDTVREWKASRDWEAYYSHYRPVVPDFFPAIIGLKVDGDRIYAVTSASKAGLYEMVVMDLEGSILKRDFRFPLSPDFEMPFRMRGKYDIEGGRILWCAYNEDKESYELHIR